MDNYRLLASTHDEPVPDPDNPGEMMIKTFSWDGDNVVPSKRDLVKKFGPEKFAKVVNQQVQYVKVMPDGSHVPVTLAELSTTTQPPAPPLPTAASVTTTTTEPPEPDEEDADPEEGSEEAEKHPDPKDVSDEFPQAETAGVVVMRHPEGHYTVADKDEPEKQLHDEELHNKKAVNKFLKTLLK